MKGDHQMSYKIIKAALPVAALGALSQVAQADTLDDAIKDAKDAGFSTSFKHVRRKYLVNLKPTASTKRKRVVCRLWLNVFRPKFNKLKPVTNLSVKLLHRGSEKARGSTPG